MRLYRILLFTGLIVFFGACKTSKKTVETTYQPVPASYQKKLNKWRADRLENLKRPDGWLTLVGLYWLKEGDNTLGSDLADIKFPGIVPVSLGKITKTRNKLVYTNNSNKTVKVDNVYLEESKLRTDALPSPTKMSYKDYVWYIIQRAEKQGLRLRDTNNIARTQLKNIPNFPTRIEWKKVAAFSDPLENEMISIADITGNNTDTKVEGYLSFNHLGQQHKLLALDGGPKDLFVIFADETTNAETYGGGRFIYVKRPDINGLTYIDFNKAYNPPCVFSDFATCPLPPKQNELPFRVEAGELVVGDH